MAISINKKRSLVFKRAWELKNIRNIPFSYALSIAWSIMLNNPKRFEIVLSSLKGKVRKVSHSIVSVGIDYANEMRNRLQVDNFQPQKRTWGVFDNCNFITHKNELYIPMIFETTTKTYYTNENGSEIIKEGHPLYSEVLKIEANKNNLNPNDIGYRTPKLNNILNIIPENEAIKARKVIEGLL